VRVVRNLRNDGTFPGEATGTLLIDRGSVGYVRDVGTFLQNQLIYSVHFLSADRVVGCREEELQSADAPWSPSRFEFRQKVAARARLAVRGKVRVPCGEVGEVTKVVAGDAGFSYHVHFAGDRVLEVPESVLEEVAATSPAGAPADRIDGDADAGLGANPAPGSGRTES
jgi:nitrogen fixation protein NifZ